MNSLQVDEPEKQEYTIRSNSLITDAEIRKYFISSDIKEVLAAMVAEKAAKYPEDKRLIIAVEFH